MADQNRRVIYQNSMQIEVNLWRSRKNCVIGGRGTGKSSLTSDHKYYCMSSIPRGTDFLLGNSMRQLLGITQPTMLKELTQKWRLVEGRDFCRGKAPARAGFDMPLYEPQSWHNCVHFRNGFVTALISAATSSAANGYNFVSGDIEEAKFIDPAWYANVMKPAIRGAINNHPGWRRGGPGRDGNPMYVSEWSVSDKGVTANQARWEKQLKMESEDPENLVIHEQLARMVAEYKYASEQGWGQMLLDTPGFAKQMNQLRCQCTTYFNFSTVSNIEVLAGGGDPESYIKDLQRSMAPLLFQIVIMGRDVSHKTIDSYYKNFDEDVHCYSPDDDSSENLLRSKYSKKIYGNNGYGVKFDYEDIDNDEVQSVNTTCALDSDLDHNAPLLISFDYNKGINTGTVSQWHENFQKWGRCLVTLNTFYNFNDGVEGVCEQVARYYSPKGKKEIILIYDSTAKQGGAYATRMAETTRFYNVAKKTFELHGWKVILFPIGQTMSHPEKYELINDIFAGKKGFLPLINRYNNDLLIASMQNSKVYYGQGGQLMKDKRLEKKVVEDEDEQRRLNATDITDAYDTTLIACVKSGGRFSGKSGGTWGLSGMRTRGITIS